LLAALSALLAAALLTATLFFTFALLAFTFLSFAVFLLALLSGGVGFAGFFWILLFVHDAFFIISVWVLRHIDWTFLIKSAWNTIWTETDNQAGGWLSSQTKSYTT
jgi:hypothetical protein